MRSEILIKLFESVLNGNTDSFYKLAWEIIAEEKKKNHHLLAERLKEVLTSQSNKQNCSKHVNFSILPPIPRDDEKGFRLLDIKEFVLDWNDVILSSAAEKSVMQIVKELEHESILATYRLAPKRKILFYGPPGTGKTLTAKVISSILNYPLVTVRFEAVVSSYLGATSSNLKKVFDYIEKGKWVVLFDEFDIIGKRRDDPNEHGEIKRVVNNFMIMLEEYEGDSLLIASTNHPHLLDMAVWRRFNEIIYFELPDKKRRRKLLNKYLKVMEKSKEVNMDRLAQITAGFSGYDIYKVCIDALKMTILENKNRINQNVLQEAITQHKRLLKKIKSKVQ